MAKNTSRPGRTLLIFFMSVAVLYGLAALGGTFKPQLGLDLSGGTRITLTATGNGVNRDSLNEARGIIEARVNGSGVVESQVTTQGSNQVVVEIPGKNRQDLVDEVKRTAQLRFRLVASSNGTPVEASGLPIKPSASPKPTTSPTATSSATVKPTATPTAKTTAKATKTATPHPRPATDYARTNHGPRAAPTKSPTPTKAPSATPGATPSATPSGTPTKSTTPPLAINNGAPVGNPLAWATDPGEGWLLKFAQFVCPASGSVPQADNPNQPLVACDASGIKYLLSAAVIEGTSLSSASSGVPPNGVGFAVDLTLKGGARQTFADISRALFNNKGQFAIVLDGQVLSAPGFQGVITDGSAQITGNFTEASSSALANSLKFGALPIKFQPDPRVEIIGATLAGDQLSAGILAGIIGMIIVMLYCLLYYRGLGLVVITSLIVAGGVTYAMVLILAKAAGFTLTLPGIAGLIVAVGITADSFIVYFERIRDEMRFGKSMRVAVEAGWIRARNTCLAADSVSLLASVVLYIFAIGVVRGFAFALGISTLIDLVVFFWFTKPAVTMLARRSYFNTGGKWSGLSEETLGIDGPPSARQLAGGTV